MELSRNMELGSLPRPPSLRPTSRMHIQPVKHTIEFHRLLTLFHPIYHASHIIVLKPIFMPY